MTGSEIELAQTLLEMIGMWRKCEDENSVMCPDCRRCYDRDTARFNALPIEIQRVALTFERLRIDVQVPAGTSIAELT